MEKVSQGALLLLPLHNLTLSTCQLSAGLYFTISDACNRVGRCRVGHVGFNTGGWIIATVCEILHNNQLLFLGLNGQLIKQ